MMDFDALGLAAAAQAQAAVLVPTQTAALTTSLPPAALYISTAGCASPGDGGGALWKRVAAQPAHPGCFRSADRILPNGGVDLANGGWWEIADFNIVPAMFGAVGDGVTNDLSAVKKAIQAAQAQGKTCCIRRPHYLKISAAIDSIQLLSNTTIVFEGQGALEWSNFALPLMWAQNASNFKIYNPNIVYSGTAQTAMPAVSGDFRNLLNQGTNYIVGRELTGAFCFYGCTNVEIQGGRFQAKTLSNTTLFTRCVVVGQGYNGALSSNIRIRDIEMDGITFGIVAFGVNGLYIDSVRAYHFGQLDTTIYTWEAPGHVLYVTTAGPNSNVRVTNCYDQGLAVAGWYQGAGSSSYKIRGAAGVEVNGLWSARDAGLLEISSLTNFSIKGLFWAGSTVAALTAATLTPVRLVPDYNLVGVTGETKHGQISDVTIVMPSDWQSNMVVNIAAGVSVAAGVCQYVRFSSWTIISESSQVDSTQPLIEGSMSDCSWDDIRVQCPNTSATSKVLLAVDGSGSPASKNVRADFWLDGFDMPSAKITMADHTHMTGVTATIHSTRNGDARTLTRSGAGEHGIRTVAYDVSVASGATTVTVAGAIPPGAIPFAISTDTLSVLGTTKGLTGYSVGDGTTVNRWGMNNNTAGNKTTSNNGWGSGDIQAFPAGQDIVLTANSGQFDGTGTIRVSIAYLYGAANQDMLSAA